MRFAPWRIGIVMYRNLLPCRRGFGGRWNSLDGTLFFLHAPQVISSIGSALDFVHSKGQSQNKCFQLFFSLLTEARFVAIDACCMLL